MSRVRLVRANNPSPMTLEGTNTWLVDGDDGVYVIDPGPADPVHLASVRSVVADGRVVGIALTHTHPDHADGASMFSEAFGVGVSGFASPPAGVTVVDGDRVGPLLAIHTPGHAPDHVCYWLPGERALFSGDHVLGRGTTVIVWPEGDMGAYIDGLDRLMELDPATIYPGHGPVVEEPMRVLAEYKAHRMVREQQVLEALPGTPSELVKRVYADVDPSLHKIAELSLRAHLVKLERDGRAVADGDEWRPA